MPPSRIPNFLSLTRLLAAPLLVPCALAGPVPFLALLGLLLLTDAVDGYLARRLGAFTPRGAVLDSVADHAMSISAFVGIWHLWPAPIRQEAPYVALIAAAYILPVLWAIARYGHLFAYHTVLSRIAGALTAAAIVPFLMGWTSLPLRVASLVEVLVAMEYLTISVLLPDHRGPIRSILAARRIALESGGSVDPARHPS